MCSPTSVLWCQDASLSQWSWPLANSPCSRLAPCINQAIFFDCQFIFLCVFLL